MTSDIFKLFKHSIEKVTVKKTERGTFDEGTVYSQEVDAIVKRRDGLTEAVNNSEDRNTQTTVHFRYSDKQYIEEGNFVQIDGKWRVIERIPIGVDFDKGTSKFIKAYIGTQIEGGSSEPDWS